MTNYLDIFSEKNHKNRQFEIIEKSENIKLLENRSELYSKALDIVRDMVEILKIKHSTQREIEIIREKTESIRNLTDDHIRKIQAEGDNFIKKIEALKGLLLEIERFLRDSDVGPEIKELILKTIYETIKHD